MSKLESLFPLTIHSPSEMIALGEKIAPFLKCGDILALIGNLGAGKTHLTKGIANYFQYSGNVTSPTFGLIHEYENTPLIHADLYRLEQAEELLHIGWEDYLEQNRILIVEWADRFPELLPQDTHWIKIEHDKKVRHLRYASF